MSVHRYESKDGSRWAVRWRGPEGANRSKTLTSRRDALAFDADLRARKFKGEALPRPGKQTLAEAFDEWWRLRGSTLSPNTQRTYKAVWKAHVENRFDGHRLTTLVGDPQLFEELTADMRARGVGNAAQRKVLVVISSVLTSAVSWQKIPINPAWGVPKPPAKAKRHARPFPPVVVERIRLQMLRRMTKDATGGRNLRDACLVAVLGYGGLRPGEALALEWPDIGQRSIAVDKAVSDGGEAPTKTQAIRSVPLVTPLRTDLDELRHSVAGSAEGLVFPGHSGRHWSRSELNNWRNRVWHPIMQGLAGGDGLHHLAAAPPYDLRDSFVSLHLRAGASPLEVAAWAGHSPQVMFAHYAHVIEELVGEPVLSAEEQIVRARAVVEAARKEELDGLVADLLEHPTIAAADDGGAAHVLFDPEFDALEPDHVAMGEALAKLRHAGVDS
jgi:integrase